MRMMCLFHVNCCCIVIFYWMKPAHTIKSSYDKKIDCVYSCMILYILLMYVFMLHKFFLCNMISMMS